MIKSLKRESYAKLITPGKWTTVHAMGGVWNIGIGWNTEEQAERSYKIAMEDGHTCMIIAPNGDISRIHDGCN